MLQQTLRRKHKEDLLHYARLLGIPLRISGHEKTSSTLISEIVSKANQYGFLLSGDWLSRADASRPIWQFDPNNHHYSRNQLIIIKRFRIANSRPYKGTTCYTNSKCSTMHEEGKEDKEEKEDMDIYTPTTSTNAGHYHNVTSANFIIYLLMLIYYTMPSIGLFKEVLIYLKDKKGMSLLQERYMSADMMKKLVLRRVTVLIHLQI